MDFERFSEIVRKQWAILNEEVGRLPYTVENYLGVFRCFFDTYEQFRGESHPPLKAEQVRRIMLAMPYVVYNGEVDDVPPDLYPYLIWRYFNTQYRADYRINHFFSGRVREMKFYESMKEA